MIVAVAILVAAVVVGWRARPGTPGIAGLLLPRALTPRRARTSRDATGSRRRWTGRRRAIVVVTALLAGLVLAGAPASAQAFDCKAPPDPDRPGTGLVGSLDPAPIGVGAPGSVYDEVGYAGQIWWTYDLGCGPGGARDPAAATDTWLGNQVFDVAKLIIAGVNWSHYLIERGSGLLTPLDGIIQSGTQAMYRAVFTTWVGLALLALAAILLVLAMRGDLSEQAKRGSIAVVALALAAGAYAAPVRWSTALDGPLLDGVTAMQRGFLSQIGVGDANTLPTVLTDQVIYTNWLRGEFGSADVPQAQQLGRDLLRAQTFTKQEVAQHQDGQPQADAKKAQFTEIAGKVGDRYSYFQGKQGSRTGAGVLALIQAACIGLFQLMSKLLVLVSMLVIRLLVMVAPALAVVALLKPEVLPATLRIGGAALVNTLLVGALAGLHSLLVIALFRPGSGVDMWLGLLVTGVVTVILWAVARPFRRLASMVTLTRDQMSGFLPDAGSGTLGRALSRFRGPESTRQETWWSERTAGATATGGAGRPESSAPPKETETTAGAPVRVASQRVSDEVDPALRAADASRLVGARAALTAGSDAARERTRAAVTEADRSLYRRAAERSAGAPERPVEAELVDGAPVYRIYRPSRPVGSGGTARRDRGAGHADPD